MIARTFRRAVAVVTVPTLIIGSGCAQLAGISSFADGFCEGGTQQPCYTGPAGTENKGKCRGGMQTCLADNSAWGPCKGEVLPDATDDCSGKLCKSGETQSCYTGPANTEGIGICQAGVQACLPDRLDFGPCMGDVHPNPQNQDGGTCTSKEWAEIFSGAPTSAAALTTVDTQSSVFIAGSFTGTINVGQNPLVSAGMSDYFVAKLDSSGKALWAKRYGDTADNGAPTSLSTDAQGDVLFVGQLTGSADFGGGALQGMEPSSLLAVKLDSSGNHIWSHVFNGSHGLAASGAGVDSNGDVIIAGAFTGVVAFGGSMLMAPGMEAAAFLTKLSHKDGSVIWAKMFAPDPNDPNPDGVAFGQVGLDSADSILALGTYGTSACLAGKMPCTDDFSSPLHATVTKYDTDGNLSWSQPIPGATNMGLAVDSTGSTIWGVALTSTQMFGSLMLVPGSYVLKLGPKDGLPIWSKLLVSPMGSGPLYNVAVDKGDNVLLCGAFNQLFLGVPFNLGGGALPSYGGNDVFVAVLDPTGKHMWSKSFGDMNDQGAYNIAGDPATGAVVFSGTTKGTFSIGSTTLTLNDTTSFFLAKVPPTGP